MNEKEIAEIRRRFRPDKTNISKIRGCYVNESHEIISEFYESLGLMTPEATEDILSRLKKTLSGTVGKNLIDMEFSTQQVLESDEHNCSPRSEKAGFPMIPLSKNAMRKSAPLSSWRAHISFCSPTKLMTSPPSPKTERKRRNPPKCFPISYAPYAPSS